MIGVGIFFCIKAKEFMEDEHRDNELLKYFFCFIIQPILFLLGLVAGAILVPFAAIYGLFFMGK